MLGMFDAETLDRFRTMAPREAFGEARGAVYRMGGGTSDDFLEVYQALVDEGILTWEQIEEFEG
jgi:hypothetical protein